MLTNGSKIIAKSLKAQGVTVAFGIVGIPVVEVAEAIIAEGIKFIGFRNEQSASYAAGAYGYLTGRPGVCLVVSGPGVVHALPGVVNATANCWPFLLLGGSSDTYQQGMGAFQELDQLALLKRQTKYSARPASLLQIPNVIDNAVRYSIYGRPGPVYVDLPADLIQAETDDDKLTITGPVPNPGKSLADFGEVKRAALLLAQAKMPLVIIGKGAAYARAENAIREFINHSNIPFLPTPMGKGVVPDSHPLCVSAARSKALSDADVVLLLGARLNWILHFGQPPKFSESVKIIQVEIHPEEHHTNRRAEVSLVGNVDLIVGQIKEHIPANCHNARDSPYLGPWFEKVKKNVAATEKKLKDDAFPMSYHRAFWEIKKRLPEKDVVFVSEGANTMDIARSIFDVQEPRRRLDAGTLATMGVGLGFAIAAKICYPDKHVVAIEGDSAFGFSAMELETAIRANTPILIIIINNNGIYHGLDVATYKSTPDNSLPSTALLPDVRYDAIAEAVGGKGYFVRTPDELGRAVEEGLRESYKKSVVINVMIQPGGRKKLDFAWLQTTKTKL
ncbi:8572_t:CDS:2 [Paraglomus brasilianum]|uniref:2-hydroxyacyl-CoA lyase n=1 Tax=Paraglomus brasilianum TaxID=144538 RepID=A0A9N9GQZ7_9GLOM|nr:8572_t:CDS:2 [Paraglomus brasilianum]